MLTYIIAPPNARVVRAADATAVVGARSVGRVSGRKVTEVGRTISDSPLIGRCQDIAVNVATLLLQTSRLGGIWGLE